MVGVPADVAVAADVDAVRDRALAAFGAVHVVCNNAGVGGGGIVDAPLAVWEWTIGVNLMGVVHGVHTFLPLLLEQDEGHIVEHRVARRPRWVAGLGDLLHDEVRGRRAERVAPPRSRRPRAPAVGVSVLCPGFVQTRIGESNRNAPPAVAEWAATPDAQATAEFAQALTAAGIAPEVVADAVRDAIVDGTFFVVPHEHAAVATTRARADWMAGGDAAGDDPTRGGAALTTAWQACTGDRRSAHGRAASSCAATRSRRSSRPVAATSWTPIGSTDEPSRTSAAAPTSRAGR